MQAHVGRGQRYVLPSSPRQSESSRAAAGRNSIKEAASGLRGARQAASGQAKRHGSERLQYSVQCALSCLSRSRRCGTPTRDPQGTAASSTEMTRPTKLLLPSSVSAHQRHQDGLGGSSLPSAFCSTLAKGRLSINNRRQLSVHVKRKEPRHKSPSLLSTIASPCLLPAARSYGTLRRGPTKATSAKGNKFFWPRVARRHTPTTVPA